MLIPPMEPDNSYLCVAHGAYLHIHVFSVLRLSTVSHPRLWHCSSEDCFGWHLCSDCHTRPDATRLQQAQPNPTGLPGPVNSHRTLPNLTKLPDPTKPYQTLPGPTSAQTLPDLTDPPRLPDLGASGGRRAASGREDGQRGRERSRPELIVERPLQSCHP